MRIVNKQEFYKMPNGTIFSEYNDYEIDFLKIKNQTLFDKETPIDYLECDLINCIKCNNSDEFFDILNKADNNSNFSFEFDYDNFGRNGMFNDNQRYMIYEKKDLEKLINILKRCL